MSAELDRVKAGLVKLVLGLVARTDYHALYPAKVVAQNADLTLELQPETAKLPALSKVPIAVGIPGAKVKMAAGAQVLLGFEGGDPKRPKAMLWGESTIVELTLNGGTRNVAHVGSTVSGQAGPYSLTLGEVTSGTPLLKVP
jgi:hypothetical protein